MKSSNSLKINYRVVGQGFLFSNGDPQTYKELSINSHTDNKPHLLDFSWDETLVSNLSFFLSSHLLQSSSLLLLVPLKFCRNGQRVFFSHPRGWRDSGECLRIKIPTSPLIPSMFHSPLLCVFLPPIET